MRIWHCAVNLKLKCKVTRGLSIGSEWVYTLVDVVWKVSVQFHRAQACSSLPSVGGNSVTGNIALLFDLIISVLFKAALHLYNNMFKDICICLFFFFFKSTSWFPWSPVTLTPIMWHRQETEDRMGSGNQRACGIQCFLRYKASQVSLVKCKVLLPLLPSQNTTQHFDTCSRLQGGKMWQVGLASLTNQARLHH